MLLIVYILKNGKKMQIKQYLLEWTSNRTIFVVIRLYFYIYFIINIDWPS